MFTTPKNLLALCALISFAGNARGEGAHLPSQNPDDYVQKRPMTREEAETARLCGDDLKNMTAHGLMYVPFMAEQYLVHALKNCPANTPFGNAIANHFSGISTVMKKEAELDKFKVYAMMVRLEDKDLRDSLGFMIGSNLRALKEGKILPPDSDLDLPRIRKALLLIRETPAEKRTDQQKMLVDIVFSEAFRKIYGDVKTTHLRHLVLRGEIPKVEKPKYNSDPASPDYILGGLDKVTKNSVVGNYLKGLLKEPYSLNFEAKNWNDLNQNPYVPDPEHPNWAEQKKYLEGLNTQEAAELGKWMKDRLAALERGDFADTSRTGSHLVAMYAYLGRALEILDHVGFEKSGGAYKKVFAKTGRERDYGAETVIAHAETAKISPEAQGQVDFIADNLRQGLSSSARAKIGAMAAPVRALLHRAVTKVPIPDDLLHDPTEEKILRFYRDNMWGHEFKYLQDLAGWLRSADLSPPYRISSLKRLSVTEREELRHWIRDQLLMKNKDGKWVKREPLDPAAAQALVLFLDYLDGINDPSEEGKRLRGGDQALKPETAIEILAREFNAEAKASPLSKKRVEALLAEAAKSKRGIPTLTRFSHYMLDDLHQQMLDDLGKTFRSPVMVKYGSPDLLADFAKVMQAPDTRSIDENYERWLPQRYQALAEKGLVPNGDRIEFAARKQEEEAVKLLQRAYGSGEEEKVQAPLFETREIRDLLSRLHETDNLRNRYAAYRATLGSNLAVTANLEQSYPGDVNSQAAALAILNGQADGKRLIELMASGEYEPITRALTSLHSQISPEENAPDFKQMLQEKRQGDLDAFITKARLHHGDLLKRAFENERELIGEEMLASEETPPPGEAYGLDQETFQRLREIYGEAISEWESSTQSLVGDLSKKEHPRLKPLPETLSEALLRARTEMNGQIYQPEEKKDAYLGRVFKDLTPAQAKKANGLIAEHGLVRFRAVQEHLSENGENESNENRLATIEKILKEGIESYVQKESSALDEHFKEESRELNYELQNSTAKAIQEAESFEWDSSKMTAAEYNAKKAEKEKASSEAILEAAKEAEARIGPLRDTLQKKMDALARLGMIEAGAKGIDQRDRYDRLAHDILRKTYGKSFSPASDEADLDELMRLSFALTQHGNAENQIIEQEKSKHLPGFNAEEATSAAAAEDFAKEMKKTLDNPDRLIGVHNDDIKRVERVAKQRAEADHNERTKELNDILTQLKPLGILWTGEGVDWKNADLRGLNKGPEGDENRALLKRLAKFTADGHDPYEKLVQDLYAIFDGRGRPFGSIKLDKIDRDGDGKADFSLNDPSMVRFSIVPRDADGSGRQKYDIELIFSNKKRIEEWMPQLHKDLVESRDKQYQLDKDRGKFWSHTLPSILGQISFNRWIGNTFRDEHGNTDIEAMLKSEEGSFIRTMEYLRQAGDAEYTYKGKKWKARELYAEMQNAMQQLNTNAANTNAKIMADIDAFEEGVYLAAATALTAGTAAYVSSPTSVIGAYLARANKAGRLLWVTKNLGTLSEAGKYGYQVAKITLASKGIGTSLENLRRAYEVFTLSEMTPEKRREEIDKHYRHLDINGDGEIDDEWWAFPAFHEVFNETKIAFMTFGASRFLNNPIAKMGVNRWLIQPTSVGLSSFLVNSGDTFKNHYRSSGDVGASLDAAWANAPSTAFQSIKMAALSGSYDQEFARTMANVPILRSIPGAWWAAGVNRTTTAGVATAEYLYQNGDVNGTGLTSPIGGRKFQSLRDYVLTEVANSWYSDYKAGRGAISPDGARKSTDMLYHDPATGVSPFAKILAEQHGIKPSDPDYMTKARKLEIAESAKGKPVTQSHEIAEALGMIRVKDLTSGKYPNGDGLIRALASAEGVPESVMRDYLKGLAAKKPGNFGARAAKTVFLDSGNTSVSNALLALRARQITKFRADLRAQGGTPNFGPVANKPWVYQTLRPSDLTNNAAYTDVIKQTAADHGITDPAQVQAFVKEVMDYRQMIKKGGTTFRGKSNEPTIGALAQERAKQLGLTPKKKWWELDLE